MEAPRSWSSVDEREGETLRFKLEDILLAGNSRVQSHSLASSTSRPAAKVWTRADTSSAGPFNIKLGARLE
jgi:hypothetical protein